MNLLLITNVFPTPLSPTQGAFNAELTRALVRNGHSVQVICPVSWTTEFTARRRGRRLPDGRNEELNGVAVRYPRYLFPPKFLRRSYGWFMWQSVRTAVHAAMAETKPDAVIGYWAHPDGHVAVRAARLAGAVSAVMVGGSDVLLLARQPARRRRILNVLNAADSVIAVSHDLKNKLTDMGVAASKIEVVARGVDTQRFMPSDQYAARQRLNIKGDSAVLVWVGRMVPVKGLDVLLDAIGRLRDAQQAATLYLVGDGVLRSALESQARALGVIDRVVFVGSVPHAGLADWYCAADLTVLPSRSEGVPNVLRESLACGTPFVASNVGGIPEIAEPNRSWLVPPNDPVALADAIRAALSRDRSTITAAAAPETWHDSAGRLVNVLRSLERRHPVDPVRVRMAMVGASPKRLKRLVRSGISRVLPRHWLMTRGPSGGDSTAFLTFDDGPHPEHTPRLLDLLRQADIHATFFMIGREMQKYPDIVRRIAAEGHAIGGHTYSHSDPNTVSAHQVAAEVEQTQQVLAVITGHRCRLFRPPHGKLSLPLFLKLRRAKQQVVLWNVDLKDYACHTARELAGRFDGAAIRPGDVILLHDNRSFAGDVLPGVIQAARAAGITFAPLPDWVLSERRS